MNPGLSCRNGSDPNDPYCFMDVEVAQAYWAHSPNSYGIEAGTNYPNWKAAPVPYIIHEAYDGRTFPRLETTMEAFAGSATKPFRWLNGSIAQMQELGQSESGNNTLPAENLLEDTAELLRLP